MATRDELEAEARSNPYGDAMGVYADLLQAEGDPRGEWIALDECADDQANARRGELLRAWLGEVADVCWDPMFETWIGLRDGMSLEPRRGFLSAHCEGTGAALSLQTLLERPIGACVTDIAFHGRDPSLHALVDVLRSAPRPQLRSLRIERRETDDRVLVPDDVLAELVAATPHVADLTLRGDMIVDRLLHPALAMLRMEVWALDDFGDRPISSTSLALELTHGAYPAQVKRAFACMTAERFPRLTVLDLAISDDGLAFSSLAGAGVADQLVELRLPALRTPRDGADAQRALDRMPRLRRASFGIGGARDGELGRTLHHAHAELCFAKPTVDSWPTRGSYRSFVG